MKETAHVTHMSLKRLKFLRSYNFARQKNVIAHSFIVLVHSRQRIRRTQGEVDLGERARRYEFQRRLVQGINTRGPSTTTSDSNGQLVTVAASAAVVDDARPSTSCQETSPRVRRSLRLCLQQRPAVVNDEKPTSPSSINKQQHSVLSEQVSQSS